MGQGVSGLLPHIKVGAEDHLNPGLLIRLRILGGSGRQGHVSPIVAILQHLKQGQVQLPDADGAHDPAGLVEGQFLVYFRVAHVAVQNAHPPFPPFFQDCGIEVHGDDPFAPAQEMFGQCAAIGPQTHEDRSRFRCIVKIALRRLPLRVLFLEYLQRFG